MGTGERLRIQARHRGAGGAIITPPASHLPPELSRAYYSDLSVCLRICPGWHPNVSHSFSIVTWSIRSNSSVQSFAPVRVETPSVCESWSAFLMPRRSASLRTWLVIILYGSPFIGEAVSLIWLWRRGLLLVSRAPLLLLDD